ncbi:MAG: PEP-CTERM sorting domain-containing protein [Edaphobacter sp.]
MHLSVGSLKSNLRKTGPFSAWIALLAVLAPTAMHATPITYNLTLAASAGSLYGGTGSTTLEDAPSASGISDYTQADGKLDALTFTIDDQTFTLAAATGNTLVRFLNGQLNDITFAETIGRTPNRFTLDTTSRYAFYFDNGLAASYGTITATPALSLSDSPARKMSPVSEPASLALFGTGLLGSIALLYRTASPRYDK